MTTPQARKIIDRYGRTVVNVIDRLGYKSMYYSFMHSVSADLEIRGIKIDNSISIDPYTIDFRSSFELKSYEDKKYELLSLLNDLNGSIYGKIYL